MRRRGAVMMAVLVWAACGAPPPAAEAPVAGQRDLALTVEAEVGPDSVRFSFHATNPGRTPIQLEFGSAQRFDFSVRDTTGAEIWRWSAERAFAQVQGSETLGAGASQKYEAVWRPGRRTGRFTVLGRLLTLPIAREQRTEIELGR